MSDLGAGERKKLLTAAPYRRLNIQPEIFFRKMRYLCITPCKEMKRAWLFLGILAATGCDPQVDSVSKSDPDLTGNSVTYWLQSASAHGITGHVSFLEKKDGSAVVEVTLTGISARDAGLSFPVHLHLGDISTDQADVAALLLPVQGSTGISRTEVTRLADETPVSYNLLRTLDACIKVHQSDTGPGRDVILAAGNIGAASLREISTGRTSVGVCKSE
jgi:hypothetical protein